MQWWRLPKLVFTLKLLRKMDIEQSKEAYIKVSKTSFISLMPKMTDSSRKVMFSLLVFLFFLVPPSGGSSLVNHWRRSFMRFLYDSSCCNCVDLAQWWCQVAVAGCDGRSDKKELQENPWLMPWFNAAFLWSVRMDWFNWLKSV